VSCRDDVTFCHCGCSHYAETAPWHFPFNLIQMLAWSPALDPLGKGHEEEAFKAEKTVNKLREAYVLPSRRQMVARACKHMHVTVDASRFHVLSLLQENQP
jgi:hypothetical protein